MEGNQPPLPVFALETYLRLLAQNITDVLWVLDLDTGYFRYISPSVERLRGISVPEALTQGLEKALTPASLAYLSGVLPERIAEVRQGQAKVYRDELEQPCKDGSTVWTETVSCPVINPENGHLEVCGITRDISERRAMEEALRKSEEQLRQSQKLEAIGQLAGGVAHDFNNLLTVIISSAELLSMRLPTDDPCSRFTAEILDAGDRAAALTRQLLAFSRKQVLAPEVLDLNDAIDDIAKMLRRLIGENILLTTLLSPDICRVKVDPGQLEQVIINLAVNARDAMPGGGRLIIETSDAQLDATYCRTRPESRPGRYALLSLIDTGVGMSAEVKARIFEPFFTTKGTGLGTGLGLATVFGIIRQSEGHIEVDSEVGAGTAFRIYLPASEAPAATPAAAAAQRDGRGSETILLVEDEEPVRKLACLALEASGYQVLAAGNGREALDLAAAPNTRVDLLLTDVVMPELGGPELAARLQQLCPAIKVLYMSGYIGDTLLRHGFSTPSDSFLQKPFSPNSLVRKVRELLDGAKGPAA
ncbi:MAG: response regulator [Candidatus Latescibacteria bacterium]|nr:response regulator [Candidatus Latescibacterota bacterium]